VTVTTPTFWEIFVSDMSGLSLRTRLPNLKFVPSPVLEQTDRQTDRNRPVRNKSVVIIMVIAGHRRPDTMSNRFYSLSNVLLTQCIGQTKMQGFMHFYCKELLVARNRRA